ncbi:MAG: hypothetical protein NT042_10020, partial [Sulfuritalea sp.]|nr:hypothetical protein [Sulfuritalea sp.]
KLMIWGHPYMAPLILVGFLSLWATRKAEAHPAKSAFVASFFLFAVGGVLAYMIQGVNVVIPAHYHGSTVGVTLAFMGLAYVLLPQLGFGEVAGRMARWQPYVYGGGQLIHILGLAWSGGVAAEDRHGHDGPGRPDCRHRRHHVRAGLPQGNDGVEAQIAGIPSTARRRNATWTICCPPSR